MSWGAVAGAAVSVVGGYLVNKKNKSSNQSVQQAQAAQDPYGPYRDAAAKRLDELMKHPASIEDTPEYKSRLMAAQRVMASQGYTGSGNALLAASQAGGDAYQQAFANLATLSGAGAPPGAGAVQGAGIISNNNNNALQQYGQIANGLVGSGLQAYQNYQQNKAWNTPIMSGSDINSNMQSEIYAPSNLSLDV